MFEVPGWNVPGAPVAQDSKKRKRPHAAKETDDVDDAQRMRSAQKNIEKLMQSLNETWEEKMQRTQEVQKEREKALEELGISVEKNNVGVHTPKKVCRQDHRPYMRLISHLLKCLQMPHLVNLVRLFA